MQENGIKHSIFERHLSKQLSMEELVELIKQGTSDPGSEAEGKLLELLSPVVKKVAWECHREHNNTGYDVEDLEQLIRIDLLYTLRSFDADMYPGVQHLVTGFCNYIQRKLDWIKLRRQPKSMLFLQDSNTSSDEREFEDGEIAGRVLDCYSTHAVAEDEVFYAFSDICLLSVGEEFVVALSVLAGGFHFAGEVLGVSKETVRLYIQCASRHLKEISSG